MPQSYGDITFASQCPRCKADLHSCKHCVYFDTASRFECSQPVLVRIVRKDGGNQCEFFVVRKTVEKETTSGTARPSLDPREAFERLFKK